MQTVGTDAGFDADAFVRLDNCEVTTTHRLNFRAAPNGIRRSEIVPQNVSLAAFARSGDWFNVIYRGESGWISANYVVTDGICQISPPEFRGGHGKAYARRPLILLPAELRPQA